VAPEFPGIPEFTTVQMAQLVDSHFITRRLLERWRSPTYVKPALQKIAIGGTRGLRGLAGLSVEFRYPIVAIAGENGTGKSTILACAACAYHGDNKSYVPSGKKSDVPYYRFGDFLIKTDLDLHIGQPEITFNYAGADCPPSFVARKVGKWSHYDRRPKRAVQFVGVSRALPATEQKVLRGHFEGKRSLKGKWYEPAEVASIKRILCKEYQRCGRAISGAHSLHGAWQARNLSYSSFNMGAGEDSCFALVEVMHALPEGGLLLVEELETGLHPGAQIRLVEELKQIAWSKHVQVITTTHSEHVLSSLPPQGRVLLQRQGRRVQAIYEPSATYALSIMSSQAHPELAIYVEDLVSKSLLSQVLKHALRTRVRIQEVGSVQAVASQLAAVRRDNRLGKAMAVYDGDVTAQRFGQLFKSDLERNLSGADSEWLGERTAALPGQMTPECWILSALRKSTVQTRASNLLSIPRTQFRSIMQGIADDVGHGLFDTLAKQTGRERQEIITMVCKAVVDERQAEFGAILRKIRRILKE